jgi:hypothetical protein
MMLCGTAMLNSMPCASQIDLTMSSEAYFAIPYGVTGVGTSVSVNGGWPWPYRDIEEQCTKRRTPAAAEAESTATVALEVCSCTLKGVNTLSPS